MNAVKKYFRKASAILSSYIPRNSVGKSIFSFIFMAILLIPIMNDIFTASPFSTQTFFGKDQLFSAVNNFKYTILKDRVFKGLFVAQNGWMSYTLENSVDDFQHSNPFNEDNITRIVSRLKYLCSNLAENGTRLMIIFPPDKNSIYPENMPPEIVQIKQSSRIDQLLNSWKNSDDCRMIDLRSALIEAKKTNQVYFSTDTHWTPYGAFIAYQLLARKMHVYFPAINVRELTDFKIVSRSFSGELTAPEFSHLNITETTSYLIPRFTSDTTDLQIVSPKGLKYNAKQLIISYSNDKNLPTAIIYHDSFFNEIYFFIKEDFSEAQYFWSYNVDLDFLKAKKPDFMILEVTERFLADGLLFLPAPK